MSETAQLTLKDWGIDVSIRRIQNLTYSFCQGALSQRRSKVFHLERGSLPSRNLLKGQRVIISVDGGRSRLIYYKGRKRNPKTNRRPYTGEWKEPKLLTIYAVDKKGKKIKTGEVPITNDGTFCNSKDLLVILEMYLVNLRLKGNGKFWRRHNAEGLLHARCQWLAGEWDALFDSILTHRIYPREA